MSRIIQLTPCSGWFYLEQNQHTSEWSVTPIAAWGLTDRGGPVGMLPVDGILRTARVDYPHLQPAPDKGGKIVHVSQLSIEQLAIAERRSR